jgi:prolipoprotein diacylglyceryl transferase
VHWNPDPVMLQLGALTVHWYGFFFSLGLLATVIIGHRVFPPHGFAEKHASNLTFALFAGLFIGAHTFDVFFYNWSTFLANPRMLLDPRIGLSSHGGAVGVITAGALYARYAKLPFHRLADAVILPAIWLVPLVRLGNFFNSEVVGRPTDLPWGVIFEGAGLPEPRHPSQLYEMILGVGLIALSLAMHRRRERLRVGTLFYGLLGLYFTIRFCLEFFKEYQAISPQFPLTMGQLLSLPGVVICFGMLWWRRPIVVPAGSERGEAEPAGLDATPASPR